MKPGYKSTETYQHGLIVLVTTGLAVYTAYKNATPISDEHIQLILTKALALAESREDIAAVKDLIKQAPLDILTILEPVLLLVPGLASASIFSKHRKDYKLGAGKQNE